MHRETEAQVSNPRKRNGHRRRLEQQRWRHMQADCYICYRPIDYTLRSPDPYSFVIDETIPLARGGTLTHDNSGPAHRWCNAIKGTHSLAWHASASPTSSRKAKRRSAPHRSRPGRSAARTGSGVGSRPCPATSRPPRQRAVFPPDFFPHLARSRHGRQNVENHQVEERVEVT